MVFAGGFVNPLCRGISPITNHPLSDTLQEIREEDPEARFLCVDDSWPITEFLLANGVKTINATNFYPAGDYEIIDEKKEFTDAYNRYCHESIQLYEGDLSIEVLHTDSILIHMNPEHLKKLEIDYLLSGDDVSALLEKYGIDSTVLLEQDGRRLYKLIY